MKNEERNRSIEELIEEMDLHKEAPEEEPFRQYYFIKKARAYYQELSRQEGRPLTYCVTTFGCQMNARDSEKLSGILEEIGYVEEAEETKADFVIFNTCTVRENANQKVYGRLGQLGHIKKKQASHDDCNLWLYDAGSGRSRDHPKKLPSCRSDFRNPQYFQICRVIYSGTPESQTGGGCMERYRPDRRGSSGGS